MELNLGVCVLFEDRVSSSSDWPLFCVGAGHLEDGFSE